MKRLGCALIIAFVTSSLFALVPPMRQYVVTSPFGPRLNPLALASGGGGEETWHEGVDLRGPDSCQILAAAEGIVIEHYPPPGTPVPGKPGVFYQGHPKFGALIKIDHGNGIVTWYAHMSKTFVHTGQRVRVGQPIGLQGATGDVTGEHLHFVVKVDPLIFFTPPLGMGLEEYRNLLR